MAARVRCESAPNRHETPAFSHLIGEATGIVVSRWKGQAERKRAGLDGTRPRQRKFGPQSDRGGKAEVGHPQTRKVVWWRAIFFAAAAIGASSQVGQALSNQICGERPPPTADAPDRERRGGGKPCRPKNKPNFLATLEATRGRPAASLHHRPQGADCVVTWSRCSVVSRTARQQTAYCSPARTKRTTLHQKLVTLRRKDTTKGEEAVSR